MARRTLGAIHIRWFRWYFAWRRGDFYLSQSELYHHQQYDGSDQSGNCHGPPSKCATSKLRIGSRARPRRRRTRISFHSPYWAIQRSWLCVPQWGFQQLCAGQFRPQIRLLRKIKGQTITVVGTISWRAKAPRSPTLPFTRLGLSDTGPIALTGKFVDEKL